MTADTITVNGLPAYNLTATPSSSTYKSFSINKYLQCTCPPDKAPPGIWRSQYLGIRVWKRSIAGQETEITPGLQVAVAKSPTSMSALISATWTPPLTSLSPTDSIVIRVYGNDSMDSLPTSLLANLTTEQLGALNLTSALWNVSYVISVGGSTSQNPDCPAYIWCVTSTYAFYLGSAGGRSTVNNFMYYTP